MESTSTKKENTKKKKKKKSSGNFILVLILIAGLSLLLYPTVANYWNSFHSSRVTAAYNEAVANIDNEEYEKIFAEARQYNDDLAKTPVGFALKDEAKARYNSVLNVDGSGMMGLVEIPSINVNLPIYHGTTDTVLQVAAGHLEWTSLPVGGETSHCVISGHRGLPSAKLFTDIDQLVAGDEFMLNILDDTLTYEVDQIRIVLPEEVEELVLEPGKDYCTLVTCTPYGINTHRLLVRGHRVETKYVSNARVRGDATLAPAIIIFAIAFIFLLLLYVIFLIIFRRIVRRRENIRRSLT